MIDCQYRVQHMLLITLVAKEMIQDVEISFFILHRSSIGRRCVRQRRETQSSLIRSVCVSFVSLFVAFNLLMIYIFSWWFAGTQGLGHGGGIEPPTRPWLCKAASSFSTARPRRSLRNRRSLHLRARTRSLVAAFVLFGQIDTLRETRATPAL